MAEYVRPTLDTKFHIDFDWWQQQKRSLRVHLQAHLCPGCRAQYADQPAEDIDWVDPSTGEVKRIDRLWEVVRACCAQRDEAITSQTPFTAAVFLTFVANDNTPLTPLELHQKLFWRPAQTILQTFSGRETFYGIRPAPGAKK